MTGGTVQEELREFTTQLFEQCGGLVEWRADGSGAAIVPPEVGRLLSQHQEELRLTERPGEPGLCVSLATDFLDAAGAVLKTAVPRVGTFHVEDRYLKRGDLQEAVDRAYTWLNARVKLLDPQPTTVEYHSWWFLVSLRSDDYWESRLSVTLNSASLAEIDLPDPLELPDLRPDSVPELAPVETYEQAVAQAQAHMKTAAAEFIRRMEGRLARDRKRLEDYYRALLRESGGSHRRRSAPAPDPAQQESKTRAVQLELRRKLGELEERYTMQARAEPIALVRTTIPALAIPIAVQRKAALQTHTIYWNSLLKQFEPLACSACGHGVFSLAFTNDEVAPVCA
ncbi:MAG: hypothetical protein ACM3U2_06480, partial [Deltaproteobacteria bacterium]